MKIIVFKDGNTRAVTGEEGKYWLTGEDRVRKLSGSIAEVREIEVPEPVNLKLATNPPAKLSGEVGAVKTGKKTARKKKTTEAEGDGERGK